jgi:hypothetical protein
MRQIAFGLLAFALMGGQAMADPAPTAEELTHLQGECRQLGELYIDELAKRLGFRVPPIVTNYSAKDNRCYMMALQDEAGVITQACQSMTLFDVQDRRIVAFARYGASCTIQPENKAGTVSLVLGETKGLHETIAYIYEKLRRGPIVTEASHEKPAQGEFRARTAVAPFHTTTVDLRPRFSAFTTTSRER